MRRGVRRLLWIVAILVVIVAVGVLGLSAYMAMKLTGTTHEALVGSPAQAGLRYENVTFPSRVDRLRIAGWLIHARGQDRRCTVLMVHGKDHNRTDQNIRMLSIADALAEHGYSVLTIDLRGHGQSQGDRFSLGYYEPRDILGAVDYLVHRGDYHSCIAGYGFSMGAASMMEAAAQEPRIDAVVEDSGFADLRTLLDAELPKESGLPGFFTPTMILMAHAMYGMDLDAVKPVDVIAKLAPRPLLIIQGTADTRVPVADARELYNAAHDPNAQIWIVPGSKHVHAYVDHPAEYMRKVESFLDSSLRSASRS